MPNSIRELKREVDKLKNVWRHPEILKLREKILKENKPQIDALEKQIKELQTKVKKKPRFPENVPQHVLDICNEYWYHSTEFHHFRIHMWNDKAVWTSYPSGGYYANDGFHPTSAHFYLISLDKKEHGLHGNKAKVLFDVTGRNSDKKLKELLEEKTK